MAVRCRSNSLTKGKVLAIKRYTAETIEWLAVYDLTSDRCYYVPSALLGQGRDLIHLRLRPARNGQLRGIHMAADFLEL